MKSNDLMNFDVLREDIENASMLAADMGFNHMAAILYTVRVAISLGVKSPDKALDMLKEMSAEYIKVSGKYIYE